MVRYADVIIDISHERLDRPFTYRIPDHLSDRILLGSRVLVPFGKGKEPRTGYVTGFRERPDLEEARIRDILDRGEEGVTLTLGIGEKDYAFDIPIPGVHNGYNGALAVAAACELGVSPEWTKFFRRSYREAREAAERRE